MIPDTLTSIDLLSGVPWQSDYKHVRYFSSKTEQNSYFNSRTVIKSFDSAKVVRTANQFSMLLTLTPAQANKVSYLKFTNGNLDNKTYYCFVKGISYEADNRCRLFVEIDFYQTFLFDVSFKNSYIERQHGSLTLIEDNLNLGQELITTNITSNHIYDGTLFIVFVASTDLSDNPLDSEGTWTGSPTPMFHYVVPIKQASAANTGYNYGDKTLTNFKELFGLMQKDWANKIVSAYVTKYCGINFQINGNNVDYNTLTSGLKLVKVSNENIIGDKYIFMVNNIKKFDTMDIEFAIPSTTGYNAKLNQYPYKKLMLSTFNGQQLEIKPQYIAENKVKIRVHGNVGINSKIMYQVTNYATNSSVSDDQNLTAVLVDDTPNALPIVVDQYSAFVQGHTNSLIASQKASTNDWKTSLKVAERTADTNVATTGINGLGNIGGGLLSGNPLPALNNATQATGSVASSMLQGSAQMLNAGDIGKNNFENLVNNQQAMLDDLQAIPPNTKSLGGNPFFEYGNFNYYIQMTVKEMSNDDKERVSNYFNTFGYKVNKYTPINFNSRSTYNYVKTIDCVVTGDLNQSILDVFKRIFNNGVFLHHTNEISI